MIGVSPNADRSTYSIPLEDSPSTRQGFGRVALARTLPLGNASINLQARLSGRDFCRRQMDNLGHVIRV